MKSFISQNAEKWSHLSHRILTCTQVLSFVIDQQINCKESAAEPAAL